MENGNALLHCIWKPFECMLKINLSKFNRLKILKIWSTNILLRWRKINWLEWVQFGQLSSVNNICDFNTW